MTISTAGTISKVIRIKCLRVRRTMCIRVLPTRLIQIITDGHHRNMIMVASLSQGGVLDSFRVKTLANATA